MGQITLPTRLNFQTSAQDLEYRTALNRIVYPQNTPRPFFYPRSPYAGGSGVGIRGLGDGVQLTSQGCVPYDYYGFLEAFRAAGLIRDCGSAPYDADPSTQYACVQFNQPTLNMIQNWAGTCIPPSQVPSNYVPTPGSAGDPNTNPNTTGILILPNQLPVQTIPIVGTPTGTQAPTQSQPTTSPSGYSPQVQFITSRIGILYPGDSWQIRITGGRPSTMVSVDGTFNGVTTRNTLGPTDGSGVFTTSGVIDSSSIGNWSETWWVGGDNAGTFSFQVAPSPSTGSPTTSAGGGTGVPWIPPAGSGTPYTAPPATTSTPTGTPYSPAPTGSGNTSAPAASSGDLINGIPNNVLMLGAAGILALMVLGGRR